MVAVAIAVLPFIHAATAMTQSHLIKVSYFCSLSQDQLVRQLEQQKVPQIPGTQNYGYWIESVDPQRDPFVTKLEISYQPKFVGAFSQNNRQVASEQVPIRYLSVHDLVKNAFEKLNCKAYLEEKPSLLTDLFYIMWQ